MRKPELLRIVVLAALFVVIEAQGVAWNEAGEAGEFLLTANKTVGSSDLAQISGQLTDLGGVVDDIDLFEIYIANPGAFSVFTIANLSKDNDTQLFLFDAVGELILQADDGGIGALPRFSSGSLDGYAPGNYYLAISLFNTNPTLSAGTSGRLVGWSRNSEPFQTGPYSLVLTGTQYASPGRVDAGPDQTVTLPASASLTGTLGGVIPTSGPHGWVTFSGPGTVTFSNPGSASTTASFSEPGVYALWFWVYVRGISPMRDTVVVTVQR